MQGLYLLLKSYFFPRSSLGCIQSSPKYAALGYSHHLWVSPSLPGAWTSLSVCRCPRVAKRTPTRSLLGFQSAAGFHAQVGATAPRSPVHPSPLLGTQVSPGPRENSSVFTGGAETRLQPLSSRCFSLSGSLHLKHKTRTQALHLPVAPTARSPDLSMLRKVGHHRPAGSPTVHLRPPGWANRAFRHM